MNENQDSKNSRHPNRKYTLEEKRNYCITWEQSELNRTDFCKANGISRSALYQWIKEFKKEANDFGFSPLVIKKKPSLEQADRIRLTIGFTNKPMQLSIEIPEYRLVSFIQEISDATAIVR